MVSIIPPQDPFATPFAQNIAKAGQLFATQQFSQQQQQQKLQQQQQQQREQARALGALLKSTDPERFGNLDLDAFSQLSPEASKEIAKRALTPEKTDEATKSQRGAQINKIADSQVKEILNNFRGPLGEIKLTGKQGDQAKKAIRKINSDREKKLKAIFGDDLPEEAEDELNAVDRFLSGDFADLEEVPDDLVTEKKGFFQSALDFVKRSTKGNKKMGAQDVSRISEEVKKNNPGASAQELRKLAEAQAKKEGFEF